MWIPDVFIDRSKRITTPTYYMKPAYLRLYKSSHLRYSSRINLEVACSMDFRQYPNDEQTCEIMFESFGKTAKFIRFNWDKNISYISPEFSMKQFLMKASFEKPYITEVYDLAYPGT